MSGGMPSGCARYIVVVHSDIWLRSWRHFAARFDVAACGYSVFIAVGNSVEQYSVAQQIILG